MDSQSIIKDLKSVTKKWTKQRKAEERRASAALRRPYIYSDRVCATDVVNDVIPEAYLKASSDGTLPAHARQIYYAARGPMQDRTDKPLDDKYFTQTLLPDFMAKNPELTADWDVVFDARGHFLEPHTGEEVPLGTLEVRNYLSGHRGDEPVRVRGLFPTRGAGDRFGAVLFIEKEGFFPLFHRVRLAERYDVAIMSTKGMSVVAARHLIDNLCGGRGSPPTAVKENFALNKVIGENETGFKGTGDTHYRMEAWEFLLAGGGLYNNLDYSFAVGHEDGTFRYPDKTPGGGNTGFRAQVRVLKEFLEGFDFIRMKPDETVLKGGLPAKGRAHVLSEPGRQYAVYVFGGKTASLSLALPDGKYIAEWTTPLQAHG